MIWQDPVLAALLGLGWYATWRMALDVETVALRRRSVVKAIAAFGMAVVQSTLDLWFTAAVGASYVPAFVFMAWRRAP